MQILEAEKSDLNEILDLQKRSYIQEAEIYNDFEIPPLVQTYQEIEHEFETNVFLKATLNGEIIGSVRAYTRNNTCYIGRLIVHPDFQNRGIGTSLMKAIEERFKRNNINKFELFTGEKSEKNLFLYQKLGYTIAKKSDLSENVTLVFLTKE